MKEKSSSQNFLKLAGTLVALALLSYAFYLRAAQNYTNQNFHHSNFFVFWLSGKLLIEGESPYNAVDWSDGHAKYGETTPREPTFLYPLPLAALLAPLGFLPVGQAYFFWQLISQLMIAFVVFALLKKWQTPSHDRLPVPLTLLFLFFGPVYLTLQIGSLGALTLLVIFGAFTFIEKDRAFLAGILLSLTMLKPPQGITILLLSGIVFFAKRKWNALTGIAIGGILLLLLGNAVNPNWIPSFLHSSQAAFDRRLGAQSTIWSVAHLACNGFPLCATFLGAALSLVLLGMGGWLLWRNRDTWSAWESFNLIIPIGYISTVYLWSYDQLPYLIPIVWVIGALVKRYKSYIQAFIFLIALELFSFFALVKLAETAKDLWSAGTSILVLGAVLWLTLPPTSTENPGTPPAV